MFGFKSVVAAVTVATMVGSTAFAADGAFTSGKPAGVKPAQAMNIGTGTLLIGIGGCFPPILSGGPQAGRHLAARDPAFCVDLPMMRRRPQWAARAAR